MSGLNIKYTATRNASFSVWLFDAPWLERGETATIVGYYTAGSNPYIAYGAIETGKKRPSIDIF